MTLSKEYREIEKDLTRIQSDLSKLCEGQKNQGGWMKDIAKEIEALTDQVKITNGKVMINKEDIALLKQAARLRKEFQDKIAEKHKLNMMERFEMQPAHTRYPVLLIIAIIVLKLLDKSGDLVMILLKMIF